MHLRTCLTVGTTVLENLRGKNSILLSTSNGVALLGDGVSLFEASWDPDGRRDIRLTRMPVAEHYGMSNGVAALVPTLRVEVVSIGDNKLSPLQLLQNLSEAPLAKTETIQIIDSESNVAGENRFTVVVTGPPILPVLGCVLQHKKDLWIALYRKGFHCLHLFRYSKCEASKSQGESGPALVPFDPSTLTLPAPIHGLAPLHNFGAFIIATCERSSSTLYMKPNTSFEVNIHSCLLPNGDADKELAPKKVSSTTLSACESIAADHAHQAFSLITQFATDPNLSAQEKTSLITAMSSVYDSALRAACAGRRVLDAQLKCYPENFGSTPLEGTTMPL